MLIIFALGMWKIATTDLAEIKAQDDRQYAKDKEDWKRLMALYATLDGLVTHTNYVTNGFNPAAVVHTNWITNVYTLIPGVYTNAYPLVPGVYTNCMTNDYTLELGIAPK